MRKISKIGLSFLIFGFTFLYIPIIFLIFFSFSDSETPCVWTKFSLKWFFAVFEDSDLLHAALTSLQVAAFSATGSVVLGLLAAVSTTRSGNFAGKKFLSRTITMPIVMPEIIIGFSLLMLFMFIERYSGLPQERGVMTVTIGHIMASMAYVHMTIRSRLITFDQSLEEAALNLGANPIKVFVFITIPIISKSILAGWLLAFTLSLDDLVIASFLSGPGATTLPILIFSNVRIGVTPAINAFATMFIMIISACLTMAYILSVRKEKKQAIS